MPELHLAQDEAADKLLSEDSLALLIGMVLDQQVPLEWAFRGPYELSQRLGGRLDAAEIAAMDPDGLVLLFVQKPSLHRYPASMAGRVQELCRVVADEHGGDATGIWREARSGDELYRAVKALPGFGEQKARIFVALLGKQLGVRPPGWREAAGTYGEDGSFRSVADIVSPDSLGKVRSYKQEMKAKARAAAKSA
ncbi:MAG TPA: HhH-GPD-type base excision DNA repair protein [Acidimicrobiales bacterium]|nr:HhH-GPD-type base excision DNA repair protein [Acidimicrobiales bacterium]